MSLNPRTTNYEFFGPVGTLFITITVPLTTYALYFGCSEENGGCPPNVTSLDVFTPLTTREFWLSLWDTEAAVIYLAWYAFCVIAWAILPGDWIDGAQMRNGQTKKYKINGTQPPHIPQIILTDIYPSTSHFSARFGYYCWDYHPIRPRIVYLPI